MTIKYGIARQVTDDNKKGRMRFACWITRVTDIHSEYVIILIFHSNIGYANAPLYYVVRRVPLLFIFMGG